jgi:phosphoesterase RecJ-like protein
MQDTLAAVGDFLHHHHRFFILSHLRPDGDAYGSTLGLAATLRAMGKEVTTANEDGMIDRYTFLPGAELLQRVPTSPPTAETGIISLDTSTLERLGPTFAQWQRTPDVMIDHHLSLPGYARLNYINPQAPATAQVLYDLIQSLQLPLPPAAASNLFVGLSTDTGSFRFRQTTEHTFAVAAALVQAGADPSELAQRCYQAYDVSRVLITREMLNATQFVEEQRVAFYHLTPDMYQRSGADSEDTEGLLEMLQAVRTVEVAFVIEHHVQGQSRVSLRSRGLVDVNRIAQTFRGGGHRLASGLRSKLPPAELEQALLDEIKTQLPPLTKTSPA